MPPYFSVQHSEPREPQLVFVIRISFDPCLGVLLQDVGPSIVCFREMLPISLHAFLRRNSLLLARERELHRLRRRWWWETARRLGRGRGRRDRFYDGKSEGARERFLPGMFSGAASVSSPSMRWRDG